MFRFLLLCIAFSVDLIGFEKEPLGMSWKYGSTIYFFAVTEQETFFEIFDQEQAQQIQLGHPVLSSGPRLVRYRIDSPNYFLAQPRMCPSANSVMMTEEELVKKIKESSCFLIYTGAGLSKAAGIPTLFDFEAFFGLDQENWLDRVQKNPESLLALVQEFRHRCLFSAPTKAHQYILHLLQAKEAVLFTENLDVLHEKTGATPYRVDPSTFHTKWSKEFFDNVPFVLCLGLSRDDKGFLTWYKTNVPQGKLIAIDLARPKYLGVDDLWLEGDVQRVLPAIVEKMSCAPSE